MKAVAVNVDNKLYLDSSTPFDFLPTSLAFFDHFHYSPKIFLNLSVDVVSALLTQHHYTEQDESVEYRCYSEGIAYRYFIHNSQDQRC